jgi:hypothetical protein
MKNELPHKDGWLIGLVLMGIFLAMVVTAIIRLEKKKTDDNLIELYDPIEPQEVRDFRHTDTVYLVIPIDSQEVAVGYLKSNGTLKGITN